MNVSAPPGPVPSLRRVHWKRAEFAALDFEATGLDPDRDAIVSFGVAAVRGGRIVMGEAVYRLVRPHVPPSPLSVKVHGLRAMDLADAPNLEDTKAALAEALRGRFLLTWFAEVEAGFLDALYGGGRRRWMRRCVDVRELAVAADRVRGEALAPEAYSLSATAERYRAPVASPHHALDDALVTAELFLVLAPKLEREGWGTVHSLLKLSRGWPSPT